MKVQNLDFVKRLEKGGLTDKEALVYVTLVEIGGAYPSKIATYCGINRTTVYKVLLNLSIKGLVNEIEKKNKLFYQIQKPDYLLKYARNKVILAEDAVENVKKIIPDIEGLYAIGQNKPKISYFEGVDGILAIYSDHINVKDPYEMVAFANGGEINRFLPVKFFAHYVTEKIRLGITSRGIMPDTLND